MPEKLDIILTSRVPYKWFVNDMPCEDNWQAWELFFFGSNYLED